MVHPVVLPISDFMSASILINSKCIKDMIREQTWGSIPATGKNFLVEIFPWLKWFRKVNGSNPATPG